MTDIPLSIEEWKAYSASAPAEAAAQWWERMESLESSIKRSVLASIPDQKTLTSCWERSVRAGGALAGVPYLVKDLFDVNGMETTASSTFLSKVRPGPHQDCKAVVDLQAKGAVFAGKTHLNEFAYGLSGENLHFGDCPHPQSPTLLSGGSSSGSAWAVGSGLVPFALATDTGGSIRVPAAFCALFGLRLTPRHSWTREGLFPLAPGFDAAGWFARSSADMDFLLKTLLSPKGTPLKRPLRGFWLGDPSDNVEERYYTEMYQFAEVFSVERDLEEAAAFGKEMEGVVSTFSVLQSLDAYAVHSQWVKPYAGQYDPVVLQRLLRAEKWTPEQIETAKAHRKSIKAAFTRLFECFDFLVLPAVPRPAVSKCELSQTFRDTLLALNAPASLAGLPALTVPFFLDPVQSLGVQILFPKVDRERFRSVLALLDQP